MLKKIAVSILALIFLILSNNSFAQSPIRFNVPVFPPYMHEDNGKISGIGVELVEKIMREAGLPYVLKMGSNYGKAVFDVKNGNADGFFLASQNAERDEIAVFSKPVLINRWCWFFTDKSLNPKGEKFKSEARVGSYLNSNTHKWLLENGYNVTGSPPNIDSLVKMLEANRINVIFLSEIVFLDAINKIGQTPEKYIKVIQEEKPFGIYISKEYLSKYPRIMERINEAIDKITDIQ